jgi:hypothetical protein
MRGLKIRAAKALAWAAASLVVGCGSSSAFAQSYQEYYDYTFSGSNGVMANIVYDITVDGPDNYLTGISGTVSGFKNPLDDGSITSLLGITPPDEISFAVSGGADEHLIGTAHPDGTISYKLVTSNGKRSYGTYTTYADPAAGPAPIPGAGWLSYLVLGFAGLLFLGKRTWRRGVDALAPGVFPQRPGE